MMNKGISKIPIIILSILLLVCPFHIYANGILSAPFVGFNANIIEYTEDMEYEMDLSSSSGTYSGTVARHTGSVSLEGDFTGIERTSGGYTYITTETTAGSIVGNNTQTGTVTENAANESGTISLNLTSSSTKHLWQGGIVEIEIILDNSYVGYFNCTLTGAGSSTRTFYVNGTSAKLTYLTAPSQNGIDGWNIVINSFDLKMNNDHTWIYPLESYGIINQMFAFNSDYLVSNNTYGSYIYPLFNLSGERNIFRTYLNNFQTYSLIAFSNGNIANINRFNVFFNTSGLKNIVFTNLNQNLNFPLPDNTISHIWKIDFTIDGDSAYYILKTNSNISGFYFMPIYFGRSDNKNISTDFALQFGLSNRLLDNLEIIANGTSSSNESAADNDSATDDLVSASDSLFNQEDSFNNSMNSNLENIDTSNVLDAMGSKFSSSANWVRVQFNTLTNNTPFGSVLSFSLILGLALLLIGRWRHD